MVESDIEKKKISDKRKLLRTMNKACVNQAQHYKKRYKRLKWKDDAVDVLSTCLNMSAVALTISGFGIPPLLIASASLAGTGLVLSQAQKTYNSKTRLASFSVCTAQYEELAREISAILFRNHMTSEGYMELIDDINARISMIDDSKLL
jgi:hypothetical protein